MTFRYKDYRDGKTHWQPMTLRADEFIRRFLQHVLPKGFHRIRHYGLFANAARNDNLGCARALLNGQPIEPKADRNVTADESDDAKSTFICRQCGAPLIVTETLLPQRAPRAPPQRRVA